MTWRFWQHPALLRECIVNFQDDKATALRGVLWRTRGGWLEFRNCTLLVQEKPPLRIDGEVLVPVTNVAFLQRLAADG